MNSTTATATATATAPTMTYDDKIIEGLKILVAAARRHDPDSDFSVGAGLDQLHAGDSDVTLTGDEKARLTELGWRKLKGGRYMTDI